MKTVFFDIEAGGLKAPFDQVICCAFKPYREEPYILSRTAKDTSDKTLLIQIRDELTRYDHLVGYYSLGYDKPFISSRLLKHGEKALPRQLHTDCYRIAKKLFKYTLHSKRLVTVCELLGIKGKTRVEPDQWERFKYESIEGKAKALKYIIDHCYEDVKVLERVYDQCFKHEIVSVSLA